MDALAHSSVCNLHVQKCSVDAHMNDEKQLYTRQCSLTTGAGEQGSLPNHTASSGDYTCLTTISSPVQTPLETTAMAPSDFPERHIEDMIKYVLSEAP